MKRVDFYITEKQYQALKREAGEKEVSVSELLRRAIDTYFERSGTDEASTIDRDIQASQSRPVEKNPPG